jgi:Xaa-Pro dipeptidase
MTPDYAARQAKLRSIAGAEAIAIVPGPNMVYFTGLHFHLSERPIIALFTPDGHLSVIIPELEIPKLDARPDLEARAFGWTDKDGYEGAFADAIRELGLQGKTLGVDGMTMRVSEWLTFQAADASLRVKPVERELTSIRAIKAPDEIDAMRQAIRLSEAALDRLLEWVKPGMTERAIAAQLAEELTAQGSHGNSFEPLVQTGPNSAFPHGFTSQRELQADEFLLIDFGGTVNGYPADITRTFCLGTPTDEMQKIYDTVLRANEAARSIAGPGVPMGALDKAARDIITEAGYGEYFIHRTGHGLGLDVHEPIPQIAAGVEDLLEPGMTFTIEPGIYIPGLGGVRIEDNVAVTDDGLEVLTSYPRRLTVERSVTLPE